MNQVLSVGPFVISFPVSQLSRPTLPLPTELARVIHQAESAITRLRWNFAEHIVPTYKGLIEIEDKAQAAVYDAFENMIDRFQQ